MAQVRIISLCCGIVGMMLSVSAAAGSDAAGNDQHRHDQHRHEQSVEQPDGVTLRVGLLEAVQRRAGFTRAHRGAFAAPLGGEPALSSADRASAWHAEDRVCFVWHQDGDQIIFAEFGRTGAIRTAPHVIGRGTWPRVLAHGAQSLVVWNAGDRASIVRVHDGEQWKPQVPLDGREAHVGFASDGTAHAVTTTGLWRLKNGQFEHIEQAQHRQPALTFDAKGQAHLAHARGGKIVVDGAEIDTGEQPSILIDDEGVLHLAYVSGEKLLLRARRDGAWSQPQPIVATKPALPTLAMGADSLRLTYLAAADHGPDALWLVRLPQSRAVLVPSLAGNVSEAWLIVHFALRNARSNYRAHDTEILFNGVRVGQFTDAIPEGRYLLRIDPALVRTSAGRPAINRVAIRSRHMNGGHYIVSSDYQLIVRTSWSERYGLTPANAASAPTVPHESRINHDQPDLAILSNALELPVDAPAPGTIELKAMVANLGESASAPARVELLDPSQSVLAQEEVPPLRSGEHRDLALKLQYDGALQSVVLHLKQDQPDFEPDNDRLALHLWGPKPPPALASSTTAPSRASQALQARGQGTVRIDWPEDAGKLWRWDLVHADHPEEIVQSMIGSEAATMVPPGRYLVALHPTPHDTESQRLLWPEPVQVDVTATAEQPVVIKIDSGIELVVPDELPAPWRWEALRRGETDELVQWHSGSRRLIVVPPGDYHVALRPTPHDTQSQRLVWPSAISVTAGARAVARLTSVVRLEPPAVAKDLWRWEILSAQKPDQVIQWHAGGQNVMLVPPGEYHVAIRPTPHETQSQRLVFPEKIRVDQDKPRTVALDSSLRLEVPKAFDRLWRWEVVQAGRPKTILQWHDGGRGEMLLPPGEYQVMIRPTAHDTQSQRVIWPQTVQVKPGEQAVLRINSSLTIEWPKAAGSIWRWEALRADRPKETVQWHTGSQPTMLLPPAEYLVAIRPTPHDTESQSLIWSEKVVVKEDQPARLHLSSMLLLELPKAAGDPWRWELIEAGKPDQVVQWHAGNRRGMLVPPGKYQVALRPTAHDTRSQRLIWPEPITVDAGKSAKLVIDSGVRFTAPGGAVPSVEFRLLPAGTNKPIQWGSRSSDVQLLPPGHYKLEIRADAGQPWEALAQSLQIEPGQIADLALPR